MGKKNLQKLLMSLLIICLMAVLSACSEEKPSDDPAISATPVAGGEKKDVTTPTPLPTATPIPTPTPVLRDYPEDRNDASKTPIAKDVEVPTRIQISSFPTNLSPFYCSSEEEIELMDKTQLKLFEVDSEGIAHAGNNCACLAYSKKSTGPDTYRIVLKKGICFADGTPVTAEDVIYNIYVLAGPDYTGEFGISDMPIAGLEEYHTQIPAGVREKAAAILEAGIEKDGTFEPVEDVTEEEQQAFWDCFDEAGELMCRDIINIVNNNYAIDAYVQAFMSERITYSQVAVSDSLRTVYAMMVWGYGKSYNSSKNTFRDSADNVYELDSVNIGPDDFWKLIKDKYSFDMDPDKGVPSERADRNKPFEDYLLEVYYSRNLGVDTITGIAVGTDIDEFGTERECIDLTLTKPILNIADFNFYVAEKKHYEGKETKSLACGAGEYAIESVDAGRITLVANDLYPLGSPVCKNITYIIGENSDEVDETETENND